MFRQAKILGLDIGSRNIKWIVYNRFFKKPTIYNWGVYKSPANLIKNGTILNESLLEEAIKQIIEDNELNVNKVSFSLSCPELIVRSIDIPKVNNKEIEDVLSYEFEKILPISVDNYITDFEITKQYQNEGNKFLKIKMVAIPNNVVEGYTEVLQKINLTPMVVDFHGNSSCRFINKTLASSQKSMVILDIGATTTTITIVEDGNPAFTRIINNASDEITSTIANSFNLSLEEGEKYKIERGGIFTDKQQTEDHLSHEITLSIMPVIQSLFNDLSRTIEFYQNRSNQSIDKIVLLGGGSFLKNLDDYLVKQLQAQNITLETNIPIVFKKIIPENQIAIFANVLGLAFREDR